MIRSKFGRFSVTNFFFDWYVFGLVIKITPKIRSNYNLDNHLALFLIFRVLVFWNFGGGYQILAVYIEIPTKIWYPPWVFQLIFRKIWIDTIFGGSLFSIMVIFFSQITTQNRKKRNSVITRVLLGKKSNGHQFWSFIFFDIGDSF